MSNTNYDLITSKILDGMSTAEGWRKSWKHFANYSAAGRAYNGVNVLTLAVTAMKKGYNIPLWGTYQQLQSVGLQVRKGEKSTMVVYWGFVDSKTETETPQEDGEAKGFKRPILRCFSVFNIAQCDELLPGVKNRLQTAIYNPMNREKRILQVEEFLLRVKVPVKPGEPAYSPNLHVVYMPDFSAFESAEAYYATLFHELIHSTMGALNREKHALWGDTTYAAEELVAELGAAMLCAHFGISAEPRKDHASYLASWVKMLTDSNRAVMTAATKAQQAVNYLLSVTE